MMLREALKDGQVLLGLCNMYPAAGIIEGMCGGWDFVWIDGQHGEMSYDAAMHSLRAAEAMGLHTVLRVAGHDTSAIGLAADLDPDALMVPMVSSAAEARQVVRAVSFPPKGIRSFGGRRVIDRRGINFHLQPPPMMLAQIETAEAVNEAESIAAVEGVDMLFFGADDMKVSMGLPMELSSLDHPRLREAFERTAKAARSVGKSAGCVAASPAVVKAAIEVGYQLLVGAADITFLRMAPQRLAELRSATGKPVPPRVTRNGLYGG